MALENEEVVELDVERTVTGTPATAPRSTSTPRPEPTGGTPALSSRATLSILDRREVLDTVTEANERLREAIARTSEENLEDLGQLWQGKALSIIDFAIETSDRYQKPLEVSFEYISPPQVDEQSFSDQAVVTARERWRYGRGTNGKEEAFEFIYTLEPRASRWVIIQYTYLNLPQTPTVTPTSTPTLEY